MTPVGTLRKSMEARSIPERLCESIVIDSTQLFSDKKEVQIRHDGQIYRLRVTKNGKLILNK